MKYNCEVEYMKASEHGELSQRHAFQMCSLSGFSCYMGTRADVKEMQ